MAQVTDIYSGISGLPDSKLIKAVKTKHCSDSFTQLKERYKNCFYKVVHKYESSLRKCNINPSDIYNEADIIILNCIKNYSAKKGSKLSTWISNHGRYCCLNAMKSRHKFFNQNNLNDLSILDNLEDVSGDKETLNNAEKYQEIIEQIEHIGGAQAKELFINRYISEDSKSWVNIAKKMKITVDECKKIHDDILTQIKNTYNTKTNYEQPYN